MENKDQQIAALIDKAAQADDSGHALRFSQAACNAANAVCAVKSAATIK